MQPIPQNKSVKVIGTERINPYPQKGTCFCGPQLDLCDFVGLYFGLLSKYACFGVGFVGTLQEQIFNEDEATWQKVGNQILGIT